MDVKDLSSVGRKHLQYIECDENEKLLYEIRKHPIGLIVTYAMGLTVSAILLAATLAAVYALDGDRAGLGVDLGGMRTFVLLLGGLLSLGALAMTAINAYLYRSNVVYITSEKIAEVTHRTIFDRKISQLSIGDVQDVTTIQNGLFPRAFNYGTLLIETAGEESARSFTFTFTPKPYEASKAIVASHEENLKLYGN